MKTNVELRDEQIYAVRVSFVRYGRVIRRQTLYWIASSREEAARKAAEHLDPIYGTAARITSVRRI